MGRLRARFGTEHALLIGYGQGAGAVGVYFRSGPDEGATKAYADHFAAIDPYVEAMGTVAFPPGKVMFGDDVVPGKILCASEYYHDWFRPNGLRYTAGAHAQNRDGLRLLLAMPRSEAAGPYLPDEIRALQSYFNHMRRALEIQDEMRSRVFEPDFDRIAARYGLTRAEAKLLTLLAETGSLKKSAQRAQRSYYTLRAQLRAVLQKTETHSQSQLMRLVHRAPVD
jgi:DNA-binding CsgD family transcriptional regulator